MLCKYVSNFLDLTPYLAYVLRQAPSQDNCYDCGVYTIKFVEWILQEEPTSYETDINSKFKLFFNADTQFSREDVKNERVILKGLINK